MPSIAKFAYQLTMEEMYGFTAIEEMGHRIMQLNDSQLEGLREHLQKAAFDAKSELWRDANKSVLSTSDPEWDRREDDKREGRLRAKELKDRVILEAQFADIDAANKIKVKNQIEAKCKKQATAEVLEVELHSIIQQKCDNKKYEWRRARESLRTRLFAWFVLVFGIACFALLDPRKFAFTGMILMFLGIIGWMGLMGYAYWLWLPKVKRKKDFALDEEIDIRCDDLVNKVHGALMREQEKRYNREKREEADWDARNAERKRLRKAAREREKVYRKVIAVGTKHENPAQKNALPGDERKMKPAGPGEADASVEEIPAVIDIEESAVDHGDVATTPKMVTPLVGPEDNPEKPMNIPWLEDSAEQAFTDSDKGGATVDDNVSVKTLGTYSVSTQATTMTQQTMNRVSGAVPQMPFDIGYGGDGANEYIGASRDKDVLDAVLREGKCAESDESNHASLETGVEDGEMIVIDVDDDEACDRDRNAAVDDGRYSATATAKGNRQGRGLKLFPSSS